MTENDIQKVINEIRHIIVSNPSINRVAENNFDLNSSKDNHSFKVKIDSINDVLNIITRVPLPGVVSEENIINAFGDKFKEKENYLYFFRTV